jgi:ATP-dependent Clp protease adaptor protein ClpS
MIQDMTDIQTLTKEKVKLDEPGLYDVIFMNDNITTMEFVVKVLKQIYGKTPEQAQNITKKIHQDGQGVVGSYVHEVAEQKGIETTLAARQENFPLQVKVKKQ